MQIPALPPACVLLGAGESQRRLLWPLPFPRGRVKQRGWGGRGGQVPFCSLQARTVGWPRPGTPASGLGLPVGGSCSEDCGSLISWLPRGGAREPLVFERLHRGYWRGGFERRKIVPGEPGLLGRSETSEHMGDTHAQLWPVRKGKLPAGPLGRMAPPAACIEMKV